MSRRKPAVLMYPSSARLSAAKDRTGEEGSRQKDMAHSSPAALITAAQRQKATQGDAYGPEVESKISPGMIVSRCRSCVGLARHIEKLLGQGLKFLKLRLGLRLERLEQVLPHGGDRSDEFLGRPGLRDPE